MTSAADANAGQIAHWNDTAGRTWAALQDLLDRMIGPLGSRAIDALAPAPGEHLVDIGCGCGATALDLQRRVGANGSVTGFDVSQPMLEVARQRAAAAGAPVRFVNGDVQTHGFPPAGADGAFSRFGVMFFDDPVAAFANVATALRPGGRLAFVCWRGLADNHWMTVPLDAARPHMPPQAPADPQAPGPFAFADPERVRAILAGAGYVDIAIAPHDQLIGGNTLDQALHLALNVGPLGSVLREAPDARGPVTAAVHAALAPHERDGVVLLPSATWIVGARKPA